MSAVAITSLFAPSFRGLQSETNVKRLRSFAVVMKSSNNVDCIGEERQTERKGEREKESQYIWM